MEHERSIFLELSKKLGETYLGYLYCYLSELSIANQKSAEASEKARKQGNALLQQNNRDLDHDAKTHKAIFDHYCKSVALAPVNSETLGLAFANRSYFLLHIKKYDDCIKDIDRALILTASDLLKAKLLCRKAECLKRLGSSNFLRTLEIAHSYIDKTGGRDRINLQKKADEVKTLAVVLTEKLETSSKQKEQINPLPVTDDYLSRVSIQYNEKYGRHLVAARDYEPGEIIFVEKIYACAFMEGSSSSVCDYCSEATWSSIPCNYCNWSMYCSESCKKQAWIDFHDTECSLLSRFMEFSGTQVKAVALPLRILITAIKETGSILNLRKELEFVDQCTEATSKGFFKNDQLVVNSIRNVYSLAHIISDEKIKERVRDVLTLILICLTKDSKLKNHFNIENVKDIFVNEDVIFLASFLIRINAILSLNAFEMEGYDNILSLQYDSSDIVHFDSRKGLCTLFSLLNHSCAPAAVWGYTESNKLLVIAIQPIKKKSQIFVCYDKSFRDDVLSNRRAYYLKQYDFICDCQACIGAWATTYLSFNIEDYVPQEIDVINDLKNGKFDFKEYNEVVKLMQEDGITDTLIKKLSPLITQGMHWKQPSDTLCNIIHLLVNIIIAIYSPKSLIFRGCK